MSTKNGIDVSYFQGDINWASVKNNGIEFAILRQGYRKTIDPKFLLYVSGAKVAGLEIKAVYHFLYSITDAEAKAEADSCIANVQKANLPKTTIIFADFEYDSVTKAKARGVTINKDNCTSMIKAFCEEVKAKGYKPGIYYNTDYRNNMLDMNQLGSYVQWYSHPGSNSPAYPCTFFQYSWKGRVNGISVDVDLDYYYETQTAQSTTVQSNISKAEIAAQLMEHLVTHDWHGYSQSARWGDGEGYCNVAIGGKTYSIAQGDRDCSSAIIDCYQTAGVPVKTQGATYTGNMKTAFLATGQFKWHPMSNGKCTDGYVLNRGDVLLNVTHHTAMMKNKTQLMQFSISETGGVTGKTGDQTGVESNTKNYYNYPWDGVLQYIGGGQLNSTSTYQPVSTSNLGAPHIEYAVKTLNHGILPFVKDRVDFAGIANDAITGIAMRVSSGTITYRVHANGKWFGKVTGCNWSDFNNGYAGDGVHSIDAIQIYYTTDISKTGGKYYSARYQVKPYNRTTYLSNVIDTKWSNTDGNDTAGTFGAPFTQILIDLV